MNTVTSLLKRFLSKEDSQSRPGSASTTATSVEKGLGNSASSASIAGKNYPAQIGSMKIADQVIEEVDEQMTITSMRKEEPRPTAQSLFTPPTSKPMDVPGKPPSYQRFISAQPQEDDSTFFPPGGIDDFLSSSAPAGNLLPTSSSHQPNTMSEFDPNQFGSQVNSKVEPATEELDSTVADDDFEKLKMEREAARLQRQKEKLARSISAQQGIVNAIELQELLSEALAKNPPRTESGDSTPTQEAT